MGREILFRGKRVDNGEWTYGVYVPENKAIISYFEIGSFDSCCDLMNCKAVVYKVSPKTVGEYTGLTDRNGVRIFEGDIVRLIQDWHDEEWQAVVEFGNPNKLYSWGWQLRRIRGAKYFNPDILLWIDMEETGATCEVIGNIHDNPELMKGEENA